MLLGVGRPPLSGECTARGEGVIADLHAVWPPSGQFRGRQRHRGAALAGS